MLFHSLNSFPVCVGRVSTSRLGSHQDKPARETWDFCQLLGGPWVDEAVRGTEMGGISVSVSGLGTGPSE